MKKRHHSITVRLSVYQVYYQPLLQDLTGSKQSLNQIPAITNCNVTVLEIEFTPTTKTCIILFFVINTISAKMYWYNLFIDLEGFFIVVAVNCNVGEVTAARHLMY